MIVLIACFITTLYSQNPIIGVLMSRHIDGCGCYLSLEGDRNDSLVFETEGDENSAWLNINGVDREFKFKSSTSNNEIKEKVGTKYTDYYSSGTITAEVRYTVTRLPTTDDYESTKMKVTIIIQDGNHKTIVKCKGTCGC